MREVRPSAPSKCSPPPFPKPSEALGPTAPPERRLPVAPARHGSELQSTTSSRSTSAGQGKKPCCNPASSPPRQTENSYEPGPGCSKDGLRRTQRQRTREPPQPRFQFNHRRPASLQLLPARTALRNQIKSFHAWCSPSYTQPYSRSLNGHSDQRQQTLPDLRTRPEQPAAAAQGATEPAATRDVKRALQGTQRLLQAHPAACGIAHLPLRG